MVDTAFLAEMYGYLLEHGLDSHKKQATVLFHSTALFAFPQDLLYTLKPSEVVLMG